MCIRLLGLTDSFYDEIKTLPLEGENDDMPTSFGSGSSAVGGFKKGKVNSDCRVEFMELKNGL